MDVDAARYDQEAIDAHRRWRGKIDYRSRPTVSNQHDLSVVYTPGVAAPCVEINKHPELVWELTGRGNLVAVVTDGSAVLGLGDIGPTAALPVMEGKCVLFKEFAGVDAIAIALDVHETDQIVDTVAAIAPSLGGVNLEDISAPRCFEVERKLQERVAIPIMHDDQHGTAVVTLAAVINALKLTNREPASTRTVITGAGASGIAVAQLLRTYGIQEISLIDSKGLITPEREDINPYKREVAAWSGRSLNPDGSLPQVGDILPGTDLYIGLSGPGLVTPAMIATMNRDALVFPMANPTPEIMPALAAEAGAAVIATGRSDFPNQINNALAFPGIFRGLLDGKIPKVTDAHKLAAAEAIATFVGDPTPDRIIPSIFEGGLGRIVADAVMGV